jgi:succinate dehydrogenase hydrophobic anchor subunit
MSEPKSRNLTLSQRGMNFETLMWLFTRLSALAMYALILFGLIGALVMGARNQMNFADVMRWAFMPNATHVQSTNVPDLAPWASAFWKLAGSALLLVAVAHGVHGLVVIADDYIASTGGRKIVRLLSIVMMLSMSAIGLYIVWTS